MKVFGHSHNGFTALVSLDDEGRVRLYRVAKKITVQDGPLDGEEMATAVQIGIRLKGNVDPQLAIALEKALSQMVKETA